MVFKQKEKKLLEDKLTMHHQKNDEYNYHKPVTFANAFLKQYIFKEKVLQARVYL